LEQINKTIAHEYYFTAADGVRSSQKVTGKMTGKASSLEQLTFCILVLRNGFTITGQAACVVSENYDPYLGERLAKEDAVRQVWPLLSYELKTRIAAGLV
jgi:hypothetical protein